MKAPKCRLCGYEHWLNESHVFPDDKPVKAALATKPKPAMVVHKPPVVVHKSSGGGSQKAAVVVHKDRKADRHKDSKERKAYRKWKARIKRNPAKASEAGQALMQSINAEITSWH